MIKVDISKSNKVISNYIHDNKLMKEIDYRIYFKPSEYLTYIEYTFVDKSHEDIIRLLLL